MEKKLRGISAKHLAAGLAIAMAIYGIVVISCMLFLTRPTAEASPLSDALATYLPIAIPTYLVALPWMIVRLDDPRLRLWDWVKESAVITAVISMLYLLVVMVIATIEHAGLDAPLLKFSSALPYLFTGGIITAVIARAVVLSLHNERP
jgi:hypothetical protein